MVIRDRRYLAFAAGNAVVSVHYGVFEVALPLWVVMHTPVPRWFAGLLVVLNTCLVAGLQVRTSGRVTDTRSAARSVRIAGLFLLLSFFLFGLAARLTVYGAGACLLAAMLVYVEGEMYHAAASWTLSYDLAPDHLHGQYQGAFHAAEACGISAAPLVAGVLILPVGLTGWLGTGIGIALASMAVGALPLRSQAVGRVDALTRR
jgi:hypothetical protein